MGRTITIQELDHSATKVVREVEDKGEVTVTRRGKPVVVISPYERHVRMKKREAYRQLKELAREYERTGVSADEVIRKSRKELEERSK